MKKITVLLLFLVCLGLAGAAAETPQFFAFNVGGMYRYDFPADNSDSAVPFGAQFQMNDTFSAGFTFFTNTQLLNVTVSPMDNMYISVYSGSYLNKPGFGLGLGYDFLVNKSAMFSAMGIYLDWMANNGAAGAAGSVEDGGALMIGLKAKFGI